MARRRTPTWHKTGRWCFTHTVPGAGRKTVYDREGIRKTEKSRAREWMESYLDSIEDRQVTGGEWTVNDIRLAYLTWAESRVAEGKMAPLTFEGHRKQLKQVCRVKVGPREFGSVVARDLKARHVDALKAAWEGKNPTTVRNRLASLQTTLNWAAQPRSDRAVEKMIQANPIAGVELPRPVVNEGRYVPAEQVAAFLAWLDAWAAAQRGVSGRFARMAAMMVKVASETGCRPGELCRARWDHFREAERVIILPPHEHKTGRKTGRSRVIVLSAATAAAVAALRNDPNAHPTHVFTHRAHDGKGESSAAARRRGVPWDSSKLSRRVKELREKAAGAGAIDPTKGADRLTMYSLRHRRATDLYQKGLVNVNELAGLLGNSARVTEAVYVHQQIGHIVKVHDRAEGKGEGDGAAQ